jgi:membrane-associated phospholipid phosphatase
MGAVNSSTSGGADPKAFSRDHLRLLFAAIACAVLALCVFPFEPPILRWCNVAADSGGLGFWDWMDRIAPPVLMSLTLAAGTLLLLFGQPSGKTRRAALGLLAAFVVALAFTGVVKHAANRVRPLGNPERAGKLWSILELKDDKSFPSGHVTGATAIAAAFWLAGRRRVRNLVWLLPPAMAWCRLCLAAHWPSDVLGGAAIGLGAAACVAAASRIRAVDALVARFGRGGSPLLRFLLPVAVWLLATRFWIELPLGRDPVSGVVVPGFETKPHLSRVVLEPLLGPSLHAALEEPRRVAVPAAAWAVAAILAIALVAGQARRKAVAVAVILPAVWVALFFAGWAPPDRFVAKDRKGAFVDWHLHGGDPHDGRQDCQSQYWRQRSRNVAWPVLTWHSEATDGVIETDEGDTLAPQFGVVGSEWSGVLPARGAPWRTPHVLVLGSPAAVDAANARKDVLDAVKTASGNAALCIPAHLWRSQGSASVTGCPTVEELVLAGAHGFEVGNRHRECDAAARERLREIDRVCRERGLLRFSFSDDHGIPSGSPCVTFLEGVDEAALAAPGGAAAVIASLRQPGGGGITPIPLLFHPGDPNLFPPAWLAPPAMAFEYFRSLRWSQRFSWLVFAVLAGVWLVRRGNQAAYNPRPE